MFRENVLTSDEVIERVSSTMVPIALDWQKLQDRETPEAKFLRPLMAERDQDQGVWIFTPDGRALGGFVGFGDMLGTTKRVIEDALTAFGPVRPRRVEAVPTHPYRGRGVFQDGSVCLAECIRTSDAALRFMHTRSPVLSSVTLSADKWSAFAPPTAEVGTKWTLPEGVAKELSRITSPMCYQHAPRPAWVTEVRIQAEVRSVSDGAAWIRYEGRIASTHRARGQTVSDQQIELTGYGMYDVQTGTMHSLLLVGSGTLHWPEAPEKRVTFDALVEWSRVAPDP